MYRSTPLASSSGDLGLCPFFRATGGMFGESVMSAWHVVLYNYMRRET